MPAAHVDRPRQVMLVTGGTSGIGLHTAMGLARLGAAVIVTGRDPERGHQAVREISSAAAAEGHPGVAQAAFIAADISTRAGVAALAAQVLAEHPRVDVLVNNAGAAAQSFRPTADGLELDLATNVAAPWHLSAALLPALRSAEAGRIVNLSGGSEGTALDTAALNVDASLRPLQMYSNSKRAAEAMTLELARRLAGTRITAVIVYPGQASTRMTQSVTPEMLDGWMRPLFPLFRRLVADDGGKSAAKASRSSIWAATDPALDGVTGRYFNAKCRPGRLHPSVEDPAVQAAVIGLVEGTWGVASWGPAAG